MRKVESRTEPEVDADAVEQAWAVHRALLIAEIAQPALRNNPQWILHRMDAYEALYRLMGTAAHGN